MPEGVVVDGHEIDISGLVARTGSPIVEANPEWFIELEATPRIGADIQLTGASVVEYTEAAWGSNPVLVNPVRVVQQGRPETSIMPDGNEVAGCSFVGHMTAGDKFRQRLSRSRMTRLHANESSSLGSWPIRSRILLAPRLLTAGVSPLPQRLVDRPRPNGRLSLVDSLR